MVDTLLDQKREVIGSYLGYSGATLASKSIQDLETEFWNDPDTLTLLQGSYLTEAEGNAAYVGLASSPGPTVKTVDETVNNTITRQADDTLLFAIAANETWIGEFVLFIVGDSTADFAADVTVPAGATLRLARMGPRAGDTVVDAAATFTSGSNPGSAGAASGPAVIQTFKFTVINGATAGNVQLNWAQAIATVADTTVKAGSFLTRRKAA